MADAGTVAACPTLRELPRRGRAQAVGYVEDIRVPPAGDAPVFTANLVDAPAPPGGRRAPAPRVRLVWNGQRRVPGIGAGTRLRFEGMVSELDGVPTVFNPRYEILPAPLGPEAAPAAAREHGRAPVR